MSGQATRAPADGKLVQVTVTADADTITDITITGEFFLSPPEALEQIEKELVGAREEKEIKETIKEQLETLDAQLLGCTVEQLTRLVLEAMDDAE